MGFPSKLRSTSPEDISSISFYTTGTAVVFGKPFEDLAFIQAAKSSARLSESNEQGGNIPVQEPRGTGVSVLRLDSLRDVLCGNVQKGNPTPFCMWTLRSSPV